MTGDATHDAHADHADHAVHPISATIMLLVIVAIFSWAFSLMNGGGYGAVNGAVTGLMALFGLLWIWVLDRP